MLFNLTQLSLVVNIDFDIQVSDIPFIWLKLEHPIKLLPLGAGEVVLQIEHRLLPVCVGRLRGRGEANSLVAVRELNVEESY